jgi:sugar/nucleoside kinase (ribokinase family)
MQPHIRIAITNGKRRTYIVDRGRMTTLPALRVAAANTAGAGDAFLAGLVCGQILGLPFSHGSGLTAASFARLCAAFSVTSTDTIHLGFSLKTLRRFAAEHGEPLAVTSLWRRMPAQS